jgi:uncharacterized LabA/DUF88 family protein
MPGGHVRSHCALYVDAGYVLASAATRVTGTSLRSGVQVDHAALIKQLISQAEAASGLPLLRVNWYDSGARAGGVPDEAQEEIGMLPRVKLRLGRLSAYGEQKGVDVRLGLDLVTHARNRVVDLMYLVSGDDDLTEAVEEAQGHGIQVVVLAVPNARDGAHAVSRHLQRAADGVEVIFPATIDGAVLPRPAVVTPQVVSTSPSPMVLARLKAPRPMVVDHAPVANSGSAGPVYTSQTGDPSGAGHTRQSDLVDEDLVDQVCHGVLSTWATRTTAADRETLRRGKPFIPGDIDRALLLDLSDRAKIYDLDEPTRYLLRQRFWEHAEQVINS